MKQALTARQTRLGQRLCVLAGTLGTFCLNIVNGMPFTMLLESLKASGRLMGLATSLRSIPLILKIPGALLVESLPTRKLAWGILLLLQRTLWLVPAIALLLRAPDAVIVTLAIAVSSLSVALDALGSSSWEGWITDLVPERQRGQFWSTRLFFCTIAMLVAVLFGGLVMDRGTALGGNARYLAFGIVFLTGALCGIADIVIHLFVPEPPHPRAAPGESPLSRILAPLRDRNFRLFAAAICVWGFACALLCLNQVYLRQEFGMPYTVMGITMVLRGIGAIGAGLLFGRAIDRLGSRSFLVAMTVVTPFFPLLWFLFVPGSVRLPVLGPVSIVTLVVAIESFISGITFAGVGLAQTTLLGKLAPERGRTLAIAVFGTLVGISTAVGALLAGFLSDAFTSHPPIYLGSVRFSYAQCTNALCGILVWSFCVPLLARVRPTTESTSVRRAFSSLFAVNPWRLTTGLYHLRQLDAAIAPREQAAAVSRINPSTGGIAVGDLARKLDDPDVDVRETAVEALGRIGSDEAADALRLKLDDPDTDLATCILRTLRHHPHPSCLPAFLRFLASGTPDQRREATRALGALGNPAAIAPLRHSLATSTDPTLLSDTGTALAKLRDSEAVFELLPRFRQARGSVLRRSLAIAIANLLARPDAFYRTLEEEDVTDGAGFDRLFHDMTTNFRRLCRDDATTRRLPMVLARIHRMRLHVETGNFAAAADSAFGIARCFAALARHAPTSDDSSVEALVWNDPRYAAGYWFLSELRNPDDSSHRPDRMEILLAVQILADWTR